MISRRLLLMNSLLFAVSKVGTNLCAARWTDRWPTRESNDLRPTEEEQTRRHSVSQPIKVVAKIKQSIRANQQRRLMSPVLTSYMQNIPQYVIDWPNTARLGEHLGVKWREGTARLKKLKTYIPELKHVLCVDAKVLHFDLRRRKREASEKRERERRRE